MAKLTKLELVCEICGTQLINLEIHKRMLYCNWCANNQKRKERLKKEDAEWERAVSPKNNVD
jgi:hypothetical protein